ncbi:MAG: hypothetical protein LC624_04655 [Halobacteriales archaeon]|nr:hypothetical protein [Halobacteriales archaeon]
MPYRMLVVMLVSIAVAGLGQGGTSPFAVAPAPDMDACGHAISVDCLFAALHDSLEGLNQAVCELGLC